MFRPEVAFEFYDILVVVGGFNNGVLRIGGFGGAFDKYFFVLLFVFVSGTVFFEVLLLFAEFLLLIFEVFLKLFLEFGTGFDQRLFLLL